ncbi:MAG: hypothetical protein NZ934_01505 [Hadesarchaea archaeon]|nr:hypothetical protein [Hadesarchaea archaeon]
MEFKKYAGLMGYLFAVLGLVLAAIGVAVRGDNLYAGITYTTVGIVQLLIALSMIPRIRGKQEVAVGNVAVQHNWWILSVGVAALASFPSSFFEITATGLMYLAILISLIWVLLSAVNIYLAVKRTGARVAV